MTTFDDGVALRRIGEGRYAGHAAEPWKIYKGPNGGYLSAIILNAQVQHVGDVERIPRSLSIHFVDRAIEGDVRLEVVTERSGRSFTSTTARMYQDDRLCATSYCAFSVEREGSSYDEDGMPEVAKPEDISDTPIPTELLPRFAQNFHYRMALGHIPYSSSPNAEVGGWIQLKDPRTIDPVLLACYADAFPPALFTRLDHPVDVPTIDLTVHFLGSFPIESDWVLCRFTSPVGENGILLEDGSMWGRDGRLLARSRQLALFKD